MQNKCYEKVEELPQRTLTYSDNLGEGKPYYFAVSFPDFMIYEEDLTLKNRAHCNYVMGLGYLGLGHMEKAEEFFKETVQADPFLLNCCILLKELAEKKSK